MSSNDTTTYKATKPKERKKRVVLRLPDTQMCVMFLPESLKELPKSVELNMVSIHETNKVTLDGKEYKTLVVNKTLSEYLEQEKSELDKILKRGLEKLEKDFKANRVQSNKVLKDAEAVLHLEARYASELAAAKQEATFWMEVYCKKKIKLFETEEECIDLTRKIEVLEIESNKLNEAIEDHKIDFKAEAEKNKPLQAARCRMCTEVRVKKLGFEPCGHAFCKECADSYLAANETCFCHKKIEGTWKMCLGH
jgi:hypothetical protein